MEVRSRAVFVLILAAAAAAVTAACSRGGSSTATGTGGTARISVNNTSYEVVDVVMTLDQDGDDHWFHIDGEQLSHADEECVPGLGSGMGLYGDLPSAVREPDDLMGKRLRVDFSGDGDDANFCFVGMGGLAGAEDAWVTIDSVNGSRVTFSMSGTFKIYDENGDGPIANVTASGTAVLRTES